MPILSASISQLDETHKASGYHPAILGGLSTQHEQRT